MKKLLALTLAVSLIALIVGGVAFFRKSPSASPIVSVGSIASPDVQSPYISWGGVRYWTVSQRAQQNTTTNYGSTTCQVLSPAATTTLVLATSQFSALASTTVGEIGMDKTIATSTNGIGGVQYTGETGVRSMSTTTLLSAANAVLGTGGGLLVGSTSPSVNGASMIIPPYTYINTKIGAGGAHTPGVTNGVCTATFREVIANI